VFQRFASVGGTTILSLLFARFGYGLSFAELGLPTDIKLNLFAALTGLGLTATLFLGPIVQLLLPTPTPPPNSRQPIRNDQGYLTLRNLFVAPVVEEIVFRVVMIPICLRGGWSMTASLVVSMAVFALSHFHHVLNGTELVRVLFQCFYTSIFGGYSSFLFLRTGNLLAPCLSHSLCNYLGFPRIDFDHPKLYYIYAAYLAGIVGFIALAGPITDPTFHHSIFWNTVANSS